MVHHCHESLVISTALGLERLGDRLAGGAERGVGNYDLITNRLHLVLVVDHCDANCVRAYLGSGSVVGPLVTILLVQLSNEMVQSGIAVVLDFHQPNHIGIELRNCEDNLRLLVKKRLLAKGTAHVAAVRCNDFPKAVRVATASALVLPERSEVVENIEGSNGIVALYLARDGTHSFATIGPSDGQILLRALAGDRDEWLKTPIIECVFEDHSRFFEVQLVADTHRLNSLIRCLQIGKRDIACD